MSLPQAGYVYVLATLDTKEAEARFVCQRLQSFGVAAKLVDTSCARDHQSSAADVSAAQLLPHSPAERGAAVAAMAQSVAQYLQQSHEHHLVAGVIALGGSAGTTIGTAAMRALPLGIPKVMVSTLASGQVRPYVGDKDIIMFNSVVDIAGVNRISRLVLSNAAAAMAGMMRFPAQTSRDDKPLIAATMFGVTTPCVQHAREVLEAAGYEVLVFHATGSGGSAMESLVRDGQFVGVLDITTTELADELVGGILSAGPTRLTAASEMDIPQVVSVGALDMVNFGPRASVPEKFASRVFHIHNENVTLMRTTPEENAQLGEQLAAKLAHCRGPVTIMLPTSGVSAIDRAGQAFEDATARAALYNAIREHAGKTEVVELPLHINDLAFAEACAHKLLALLHHPAPLTR